MVIITSFQYPESSIKLELLNVEVLLDNRHLGCGTLYINEQNVCWQKEGEVGFCLDYYNIALHAVSRDPDIYAKECIYIHTDHCFCLNHKIGSDEEDNGITVESDQDSSSESEADLSVLILSPELPSQLYHIYDAIKLCQKLNPDPVDIYDDANFGCQSYKIEDDLNILIRTMETSSVNPFCHVLKSEEEFEDAD